LLWPAIVDLRNERSAALVERMLASEPFLDARSEQRVQAKIAADLRVDNHIVRSAIDQAEEKLIGRDIVHRDIEALIILLQFRYIG
jgi:hypothetical protein